MKRSFLAALTCAVWLTVPPVLAQKTPVADQAPAEALERILAGGDPKNPEELRLMQEHVQKLIAEVLPATVNIGGAAGVIIDDGYVLTAGHVIREPDRRMQINLHDGRSIRGRSLGLNGNTDTGLIKIETDGELPTRKMGKSGDLEPGQWCLMLGHPSGAKRGRDAPARLGRVLRVPERGYMVTDCTMQSGDSGGPLFDMQGRVIGINSRISGNLANNMHVPIDAFHREWEKLVAGEVVKRERSRGRGGMRFGVSLDRSADHAKVSRVVDDSPAAKAGLKVGDVITRIDDQEIDNRRDYSRALFSRRSQDEIKVEIRRGDETLELVVKTKGEEQ